MSSKILIDLLFWLHMGVIVFGVAMGFFLPFPAVLILIALHRAQFYIFHDCLLSKLQKHVRGLRPQEHFLQFVVHKIFHKNISKHGAKQLDYALVLFSIIIAIFNTFY